jgi:hypothetical protein
MRGRYRTLIGVTLAVLAGFILGATVTRDSQGAAQQEATKPARSAPSLVMTNHHVTDLKGGVEGIRHLVLAPSRQDPKAGHIAYLVGITSYWKCKKGECEDCIGNPAPKECLNPPNPCTNPPFCLKQSDLADLRVVGVLEAR